MAESNILQQIRAIKYNKLRGGEIIMDQKTSNNIAVIAIIISLVAIIIAWSYSSKEIISGNETIQSQLNELDNELNELETDLQERLNDQEKQIAITQAETRLLFVRETIDTTDDYELLAELVDERHTVLMDAFDIDEDLIPPQWEDIAETFSTLERLILNENEDDVIELADIMIARLNYHTTTTPYEVCQEEGGDWREFPTACVDNCYAQDVCAQVLTYGCDCGPAACWTGMTCKPLEN